ncbi:MAG: type II toxin-antitoxin system VapC family toxin [Hyphomicrobiales bacterium]|nr:type II toxin-antitoxin system VapC family toxin [Hyphomicrobiales bacterium]MBV9138744.1 type II toxin-antitoxin system VapC family toxin [Hyphomicrobiales bacterium]MBV9589797.1 type II toxin-antitoxin system VapC family toxin [Hyphomicrobiales bacterium]
MILVDTNIISEVMRRAPEARVVSWLDSQVSETLYLSTVSLAELLLGVALLPDGKRKRELGSALKYKALGLFGEKMLAFDEAAAAAFASVMSRARAAGRSIGIADGQIAAIAKAHGLIVATRDTEPFEAAGLRIINPWKKAG